MLHGIWLICLLKINALWVLLSLIKVSRPVLISIELKAVLCTHAARVPSTVLNSQACFERSFQVFTRLSIGPASVG